MTPQEFLETRRNVKEKENKYTFNCDCPKKDNKGKGVLYKNNLKHWYCSHNSKEGQPTNINKTNKYKDFQQRKENYYISHNIDFKTLQNEKIIDSYFNAFVAPGKLKKLVDGKEGKLKFSAKGILKKDVGSIYPILGKTKKKLYLFSGEFDYYKGYQDKLTSTTKIFGENTNLSEKDIEKIDEFAEIILVPDTDKAGIKARDKTLEELNNKLIGKKIGYKELTFKDNKGKDYCDYRKKYSLKEFLSLPVKYISQTESKKQLNIPNNKEWIEINDKGKWKVVPGIAADCYFNAQEGDFIYTLQNFWLYASGVWKKLEEEHIKKSIQKMIGRELSRKALIEDIFFQIKNFALQEQGFEFNKNPDLLNFQNGVLDIKSNKFRKHKREDYLTLQFNFSYSQKAKCPKWLAFLASLQFKKDTYQRLQEWTGYCLVPSPRLQKCLYLKGEGANGKGTFLEILAYTLGNVSSIEPTELFDRFKIAEIQGKLANICTDIKTTKVLDERFKKIVAGEPQIAEEKHKKPFHFRPFAKFLFSANDFIPTKDRSHGFFRRFDILEFQRKFSEEEQDEFLQDKLKEELSGIFIWAYKGLLRLIDNNWKMTKSSEMQQTMEEFKKSTNPLQQFVEECCEIKIETSINTNHFREKYCSWCQEKGYEALADNRLGREMKRLGFNNVQIRKGMERFHVYKGITFCHE